MKTITLSIIFSIYGLAADKAAPKEAPLTELQLTHMQRATDDAKLLDLQYKPAELQKQWTEYQKALEAAQKEFDNARQQACAALGVPKDKMAECQPDLAWIDPTTKGTVGRVVWTPVVAAPASIGAPSAGAKQ